MNVLYRIVSILIIAVSLCSAIPASAAPAWTSYGRDAHVSVSGDTVTFTGHTTDPFVPMLFRAASDGDYRIVTWNLTEDSAGWHTVEGAGFVFNAGITDGKISGHAVMLGQSDVRYYKMTDVSVAALQDTSFSDLSGVQLLSTFSRPEYSTSATCYLKLTMFPGSVRLENYSDASFTGTSEVILRDTIDATAGDTGYGPFASFTSHNDEFVGRYVMENFHVTVTPNASPSLTAPNVTVPRGSAFKEMDGVTASDNEDGDITGRIQVASSDLDINTPGEYTVSYSVVDIAGAAASHTRAVSVSADALFVATDSETAEPIPGVEIAIEGQGSKTTGSNGETAPFILAQNGYNWSVTDKPEEYLSLAGAYRADITAQSAESWPLRIPVELTRISRAGSLRLHTLSEDTGAPLAGAVFCICAIDGNKIAEITTDINGEALINLDAGEYSLRELKAPTGFSLQPHSSDFTITSGETETVTILSIPEKPADAYIRVTKLLEGTDTPLEGAVFEVYRSGTDERAGCTLITGEDGTATSGGLSEGDYYLVETKSPEGMRISADKAAFTVLAGHTTDVTVYNIPMTGTMRLLKKAEGDGRPLPGAAYGIFGAEGDEKLAEIITDQDGAAKYDLAPGEYRLIELKAPEGMRLSESAISFTVEDGLTTDITVYSKALTGSLRVMKKAASDERLLPGAVFGIYRASDSKKLAEITTGKDGMASCNLNPGGYYLLELNAPEGMKLSSDKNDFIIKDGHTTDVTVYNTPIPPQKPVTGILRLVKRAAGSGENLPGAVYGVYSVTGDRKIIELTTGSDGEVVHELEPGSYYVRELKAPVGFLAEPAKIFFTVKASAAVLVEVTDMRQPLPNGSVRLIKRGPDNEAVTGAKFGVYVAAGGSKIAEITTDPDGIAFFELAPGAYYLLETDAPNGYTLNTQAHGFTVISGRTAEVRVVNQRIIPASTPAPTPPPAQISWIEIPKTGEAFPARNYALALLLWGLAGLCGFGIYRMGGENKRPDDEPITAV